MNDLYAKYRVLRQISEGAHSKVYLAENRVADFPLTAAAEGAAAVQLSVLIRSRDAALFLSIQASTWCACTRQFHLQ